MENPVNEKAIAAIKKVFQDGALKMTLKDYTKIGFVISGTCQHYDEKTGKCLIYKDRPEICRKFFCEKSLNS